MSEYRLARWEQSGLLKEASEHLLEQPEYIPMSPEARSEMAMFCRKVRSELTRLRTDSMDGLITLLATMRATYGLNITSDDNKRYVVTAHGYSYTFILDI